MTINRSACFAWAPVKSSRILLSTATLAGALDESFSNESKLEIWDPFTNLNTTDDQDGLRGSVVANAKFSRLAWGHIKHPERPLGVIAAGMENGELGIYDPTKILANETDALIWSNTNHNGPIRGLDFNPSSSHLLATGANAGEIWIWDLNTPQKPYSPGTRSRNLEDITSLAWNRSVSHILATASSSGYTVVWDLKGRREIAALNFAGAQAALPNAGSWMAQGQSAKRGISSVSWHPENPTKLATASEDDLSPVVMIWDLRNTRQPEKVLTGHEKGILSMEWCTGDADLLLSCGKDSRSICWNPQTGNIVAELPRSTNWAFEAHFAPRIPDQVAVGSYDGKIEIHNLQATRTPADLQAEQPQGADIFEQGNLNVQSYPAISLSQAPKWLKRPASVAFGFGGKMATVSLMKNSPTPHSTVEIKQVITEGTIRSRALKLQDAISSSNLVEIAEEYVEKSKAASTSDATWRLLVSLFNADSRDELITLLGFAKDDVKAKVDEAIKSFKDRSLKRATSDGKMGLGSDKSDSGSVAREPLVTFADIPTEAQSASSEGETTGQSQAAPSEASVSALSESTAPGGTADSEITEPNLWDEEFNQGPAQTQNQAAVDFYSSMASGRPAALPDHLTTQESFSVAATAGGSRPSSIASADQIKANTFKIYPPDESDADKLITKALILGDFASAVSLCLSADRFADALLLAVRGGPTLLAETQKTYFERQTTALPYLRLFQSIATNDLSDIVQNADLADWQEIFVVVCTFAKADEFSNLIKQLGQRLEFQHALLKGPARGIDGTAFEMRKNALLCFLAAGKLDKVVDIWNQELAEEETAESATKYSAHAQALQTFVEKVAIFQSAVKYVDEDLKQPTTSVVVVESGTRTYKLAALYDRYKEYAELLAMQGLPNAALAYLAKVPADYRSAGESLDDAVNFKDRISRTAGIAVNAQLPRQQAAVQQPPAQANTFLPYSAVPAQTIQQNAFEQTSFAPNVNNPYGPSQVQQTRPPMPTPAVPPMPAAAPTQSLQYGPPQPYAPANVPQQYNAGPYQPQNQYAPTNFAPPQSNLAVPLDSGPPPPKRVDGGWNDAPNMQPPKRTGSAMSRGPIASPFPNSGPYQPAPASNMPVAPPARTGNSPAPGPPPPRGSIASPSPLAQQNYMQPPNQYSQPPPQFNGHQQQLPANSQYASNFSPPSNQYGPNPAYASQPNPAYAPQVNPAYAPQQNPAYAPQQSQNGQYAPSGGSIGPPPSQRQPGVQSSQGYQQGPPPQMNGSAAPASPKPEVRAGPPPPKHPVGDRSHIPEEHRHIYETLASRLQLIRENTPPQQKKMVDDTERRLNVLFDALNCETLSSASLSGLEEIIQAIEAGNPDAALDAHLRLLTSGPAEDKLTAWMPAVKIIARVCGN